MIDLHIS